MSVEINEDISGRGSSSDPYNFDRFPKGNNLDGPVNLISKDLSIFQRLVSGELIHVLAEDFIFVVSCSNQEREGVKHIKVQASIPNDSNGDFVLIETKNLKKMYETAVWIRRSFESVDINL